MSSKPLNVFFLMLAVLLLAAPVRAATYLALAQAQQDGFPEADQFTPAPVHMSPAQMKAVADASGVRVRLPEQKVWVPSAAGKQLGWFIVDEVYGKHEFITYAASLNNDGSVKLIEIMDYRETHGGEVRNPAWLRQFVGKMFGANLKLDDDIKNISGATLSCRHLADGVKRLLALHHLVLAEKSS